SPGNLAQPDSPRESLAEPEPEPPKARFEYHPHLNGMPCDAEGNPLPNGTPPPRGSKPHNFDPFKGRTDFELADFLFRKAEMSAANIDELMKIMAALGVIKGGGAPFASHTELYSSIDDLSFGDAPWNSFAVSYMGEVAPDAPGWKRTEYEVWFRDPLTVIRNFLENPDFNGEIDTTPLREFDENGQRRWKDMMSGNWVWRQADKIYAEDPSTEGAMFVPLILGSDKTTVSVATGQNEYYPLYISIGNFHNNVRRAHRESVIPIGFLAIPKGERKDDSSREFLQFCRQLFHSSLSAILFSVKPFMTTLDIVKCPDGHYRRAIYGLGPYIADYPEQALLACVVQGWCAKCFAMSDDLDAPCRLRSKTVTETLISGFEAQDLWDAYGIIADVSPFTSDFPRADIHELLAPDLLHQVIKGTFKDHLVTWVGEYLKLTVGEARANTIIDDIDRRIAAVPPFPGLRRFPDGRRFKQWTGDDSKALMKVYLPALIGYVPAEILKTFQAFLDFCYLVRRSVLDEKALDQIDNALQRFHQYREVFRDAGVRPDGFSLPRQHSLKHYRHLIEEYGAPNGLCSSITESKHVKAVKKPWRRSNKFHALGQMLLTNQRLDKLGAARAFYSANHMLDGTILDAAYAILHPPDLDDNDNDDEGPVQQAERVDGEVVLARTRQRGYPRDLEGLADCVNEPHLNLVHLIRRFLYDQAHLDDADPNAALENCPQVTGEEQVNVFHSARAIFFAPSDHSGIGGMRQELIWSTPSWRKQGPRRDCVFAVINEDLPGMQGMAVLRVLLFFSFTHNGEEYPCALVNWLTHGSDRPHPDIGMWVVNYDVDNVGHCDVSVVHIDCILRLAHLIPVYGDSEIPADFHFSYTLDVFDSFFINKYIDHQANEIAF
ncbi:hypothetical protein CPB83DRAFT_917238, partial [Crepidotus variabilis]